ncbi:MAG: SPOR domain-containing protein, partial [Cyanobacteriota bacterium]
APAKATATKKTQSSSAKQAEKSSASAKPIPESAAPATGGLYYVVTNYGSDRDLAQARTIVPDAYVEKFPKGTRIQMGAFPRESQAKTLVEQLKQQGVKASVYHP